ncbi:MAG TPA: glycoside hydrolase family 2 TIM barrel-domain containing protein, partial [Ignavibacteriaceae bacterium]|nr:glycoside hydrolase family 2 TIM barrel-domain containing protein [Ignavibacteriaceae bacterium]
HFKGADYFTEVWLNDKFLGKHEGYFQPFFFDVTESLNESFSLLIVKVTSPLEDPGKTWPHKKKLIKGIFSHHDCRPGAWNPQFGQDRNTGGIWNDVSLFLANEAFIESINISSKINFFEDKADLKISIDYYKKNSSFLSDEIEIILNSPSGKKVRKKFKVELNLLKGNCSFLLTVENPELWWSWDLGKPNLYKLKLGGKYLSGETNFGIREVFLDDKNTFYLNGKRLFFRGTNIIPEQNLSSLDENRISRQIKLIKEANINIIRIHAHVNRNEYYDECDKAGILVWQDFALQWTYDQSEKFKTNACLQIKDMVKLLFNHPSICFWCCHNEPGDQIKTLDPLLYDALLNVDRSRIIRMASNYEEHPYFGWYWGNKEHYSGVPMGPLVTEFGAQGLPVLDSLKKFIPDEKLFPPEWQKWEYHDFQYDQTFLVARVSAGKNIEEFINNSQSYQSSVIKTAADFYRRERFKKITGIFQFMFIDCWESITWSVVDYFEQKKAGYYTLQEAYQPVYASVEVRQDRYIPGTKLHLALYIINDLQKNFNNCSLDFQINNDSLGRIKLGKIEDDSIRTIASNYINIFLPKKIPEGKHKIILELKSGKRIISKNSFDIEIVGGKKLL